jgi:putative tricarboxylic transport membrane protein
MKKSPIKVKIWLISLMCLIVVVVSACGNTNTSSSKNSEDSNEASGVYKDGKPVSIIAGAPPGSGFDLTARSLAQTLEKEKIVNFPVPVLNVPGATGAVALAQIVTDKKGDAQTISITSPSTLINYLRGDSKYGYKDVTVLTRLMTDYFTVVVPPDSPYKDLKGLLEAVKKDPDSITIGAATDDRLPFALLLNEIGGDVSKVNFVAYEGGGELINGLLNGDAQAAISGVSEFVSQIGGGSLRSLAVLSEQRLGGETKDVPTAIEQGINVTYGNWRGVYGPPDMPKEAVKYWEDKIEEALNTPTWKEIAKKNQWEITFMKGEEFKEFLDNENEKLLKGLQQTGQVK